MEDLLAEGVVEWTYHIPKRDSPRDQLVMNLSCLNRFIRPNKFRMATVAQVHLHLQATRTWLAALDLQDAYWHVSIHSKLHKFMDF